MNDRKYYYDFVLKTVTQEVQFGQWLKLLFYVNQRLQEQSDAVFHDAYYTKLYEALKKGLPYAEKVAEALQNGSNVTKRLWYDTLIVGLQEIKAAITDDEFAFIEYKRNNACHIFQNKYERIQDDGSTKETRNGINIEELQKIIMSLMVEHDGEHNLNAYLYKKLYPLFSRLYQQLIDVSPNSDSSDE